jgi:hypothetical protein
MPAPAEAGVDSGFPSENATAKVTERFLETALSYTDGRSPQGKTAS